MTSPGIVIPQDKRRPSRRASKIAYGNVNIKICTIIEQGASGFVIDAIERTRVGALRNKKGAKPKFRAPTGDTTKERQPLQQSTDRLAPGRNRHQHLSRIG